MTTYRCICERGYVRCPQPVPTRGQRCNQCVHLATGGHHADGYHGNAPATVAITLDDIAEALAAPSTVGQTQRAERERLAAYVAPDDDAEPSFADAYADRDWLAPAGPYSTDPTRGLQPPVGRDDGDNGWVYRPGPIVKPAGGSPAPTGRDLDLAAERPPTGRPHCSDCGAPLDPSWCDPLTRALAWTSDRPMDDAAAGALAETNR